MIEALFKAFARATAAAARRRPACRRACRRPRGRSPRERAPRRRRGSGKWEPAQRREGAGGGGRATSSSAPTPTPSRAPTSWSSPGRARSAAARPGWMRGGGALRQAVLEAIARGRPFLGICIGHAAPVRRAARRAPSARASASLPGRVVRLRRTDPGCKIPHMGWNQTRARTGARPRRSARRRPTAPASTSCTAITRARPTRGRRARAASTASRFCAAVARDNVFALPVPPREEPGGGPSRCCAASSRPIYTGRLDVGFPRYRSDGRRRRAAGTGTAREREGLRRARPGRWRRGSPPPVPRASTSSIWTRPSPGGRRKDNRDTIARIAAAAGVEVEAGGGVRSLDDCERAVRRSASSWRCWGRRRFKIAGAGRGSVHALARAHRDRGRRARGQGLGGGLDRDHRRRRHRHRPRRRARGRGRGALHRHRARRHARRPQPRRDGAAGAALLPCPVIASGGVARLEDLDALAPTGAEAVVVGKALYEQVFTIEQAVARVRAQSR